MPPADVLRLTTITQRDTQPGVDNPGGSSSSTITQLLQPATPSAAQLADNEAVRQHREQQQLQLQQRRQQELDELVQTKKKAAVARFWELLVDFIVIKAAPLTWLDVVPADHPFLRVVEGRLQLAPRRDLASAS